MPVQKRDEKLADLLRPHLRKIHTDMAILTSLWKEGRLEDPLFLETLEEIAYETEQARHSFGAAKGDPNSLPIYAIALFQGDTEMGMVGGPTPNLQEMLSDLSPWTEKGLQPYIVRIQNQGSDRRITRLFRFRVDGPRSGWERVAE